MELRQEAEDGIAAATYGDVFITLWSLPATAKRWRWQRPILFKLARERPNVVFLTLILSTSDPPDGALRAEMQGDFRELGSKLRRIIVVPLGSSMWMSVVRTIVRGLLILSGQARNQTIVATVDEGLDVLRDVATADTPSRTEMRALVDKMASSLGVDSPTTDAPRA